MSKHQRPTRGFSNRFTYSAEDLITTQGGVELTESALGQVAGGKGGIKKDPAIFASQIKWDTFPTF